MWLESTVLDVRLSRRRMRRGTRAFRREIDIDDARIFVDHGFQWDGAKNVWLTRARAAFVLGSGPSFRLRPRGFIERAIGWQRGRPSGDECIDVFFVALTSDPESTWAALTARSRWLMASAFDDSQLVSDGQMVTLLREADFGREADAAAAVELVAEVTAFRAEQFKQLSSLPGAIYYRARGGWQSRQPPSILLHLPSPVVLEPISSERGATLSATANCRGNSPRVVIDLGGNLSASIESCARIGVRLEFLNQLGLSRFSCDGSKVTLVWPNFQIDRPLILAGARLATELAGNGRQALYR